MVTDGKKTLSSRGAWNKIKARMGIFLTFLKNLGIVETDDGGVIPVVFQVGEEEVGGEGEAGENHKCPNHPLLTS